MTSTFAWICAGLAAFGGVVATLGAAYFFDKSADEDIAAADARASAAMAQAGIANERAAAANEQAAKLEVQAAEVNKQVELEQSARLRLDAPNFRITPDFVHAVARPLVNLWKSALV